MNTTIDFLEALKAKTGLSSDYALAKKLKITRAAVSKYRQKRTTFDDSTALTAAEILEVEPATVLAAVHAERAKTEAEKSAWKSIYERLGGIAASVMVATLLAAPSAPAKAAEGGRFANVYYVKSRRRLNTNPFLQILQPFLPAF